MSRSSCLSIKDQPRGEQKMTTTVLAPVAAKARIDVLDILRGIAILGIFFMNIPYMAQNSVLIDNDVRSIGWTLADRSTWAAIDILAEGTQRGLLEMLFAAGMMVITAKAMAPDGPIAVADLYYRRNLWLLAFGLFDVFVLLWVGDILHIYAIAALFLFPFRKLAPGWLVLIGLSFALATAAMGAGEYVSRTELAAKVEQATAKQQAGMPLADSDRAALKAWQDKRDKLKLDVDEKKGAAKEDAARKPGASYQTYADVMVSTWFQLQGKGFGVFSVIEAFCAMLIGVALWKWRIIQGGRSGGFYLGMVAIAYGVGITIRAVGVTEIMSFSPIPKTIWITEEFGRLAMTLGHLALINLLVKSAVGSAMLSPFKAAGRMAFSLYFTQQIIGLYILFAPFGLGLYGKFGWAELAAIAAAVIFGQLIFANLYMRVFVAGPLEWLWRSLAYVRWQPLLRRAPAQSSAAAELPVGTI